MLVAARVVPLTDVLALAEMVPLVLVELSAVGVELAFEVVDRAEVAETAPAPPVVLRLLELSAEDAAAEDVTPAVGEAVSRALPGVAPAPAPAPDEDPAVLEAPADEDDPELDED